MHTFQTHQRSAAARSGGSLAFLSDDPRSELAARFGLVPVRRGTPLRFDEVAVLLRPCAASTTNPPRSDPAPGEPDGDPDSERIIGDPAAPLPDVVPPKPEPEPLPDVEPV